MLFTTYFNSLTSALVVFGPLLDPGIFFFVDQWQLAIVSAKFEFSSKQILTNPNSVTDKQQAAFGEKPTANFTYYLLLFTD